MRLHARFESDERGNATVIAVLVLFVIGSLVGVVLSVSQRNSAEISALSDQNRAFFVAQTGINAALAAFAKGSTDPLGSVDEWIAAENGAYWVDVQDGGDSTWTITAHARAGLQRKDVEVVVERQEDGIYRNGIFAGNSSGDPSYVLQLGGTGTQADLVTGDVYSGGSVKVSGDASVVGTIRAVDGVTGNGASTAETGKKQAIPDIAAMNYPATADVDVAKHFSTGGAVYKSSSAGGSAWQLPESDPAHIFRKNPSDRSVETLGTVKDDYFLEDPYEKVRSDDTSDGSDAYAITLSGVGGEPGTSSNQKVFFVDGNLWIHNYQTMSMKFQHADQSGIQVTFVVRGNLYISDNLFYSDPKKDGVAFVAMKDPKVADSGNVYFGDPEFGTLERMYAFLYAENDFHDNNLDAAGSKVVELYGNMTAGNHVDIQRDYVTTVKKKKVVQHSKLLVDFDDRIATGALDMPGLPQTPAADDAAFEVLSWREVAH